MPEHTFLIPKNLGLTTALVGASDERFYVGEIKPRAEILVIAKIGLNNDC
jgi:hypothetical protein